MVVRMEAAVAGRQFGLDWLRIGAFGALILYHIGMFFVPWGWHVKTNEPIEWLQWPMMAINPWRLCLLFVISGVVSRALLAKLANPKGFATSRSSRLLIPLFFGMAVFVVPQPWVELSDKGAYSESVLHFWIHDYAEFGASRGTPLPTWNHLWFVAYLWVYSMILAIAALLPLKARAAIQSMFDYLFGSWRLFVIPIAWLFCARAGLFPAFGETHALVDDPYAHAVYGFAFFFGVGLARSNALWPPIMQNWKLLLGMAALACAMMFYIKLSDVDGTMIDLTQAALRAWLAWSAIVGLLGMAQTHLHFDGPVRRYLTEAIFPYYIAHQTIIIVVGYYLKQSSYGSLVQFFGILAATIFGCAATYELARRINWLKPVLGLKLARAPKLQRSTPQLAEQ
jgi:glucans biosynthesis protein C